MAEKYTVRRIDATTYDIERPDGTKMTSATFQEQPAVPDDLAPTLVQYAENNGQSGIVDVLDLVLSGVRYIDATR